MANKRESTQPIELKSIWRVNRSLYKLYLLFKFQANYWSAFCEKLFWKVQDVNFPFELAGRLIFASSKNINFKWCIKTTAILFKNLLFHSISFFHSFQSYGLQNIYQQTSDNLLRSTKKIRDVAKTHFSLCYTLSTFLHKFNFRSSHLIAYIWWFLVAFGACRKTFRESCGWE